MKIVVTNLKDEDEVYTEYVRISGVVIPKSKCGCQTEIQIMQANDDQPITTKWPVVNGRFKSVLQLKMGRNPICIKLVLAQENLVLIRNQQKQNFFVLPIYFVCCDSDGRFQGPVKEDCATSSAQNRILTGVKLLQLFLAEKLEQRGFGRKTFRLHCQNDKPYCFILKSSQLSTSTAHSLSGRELWTRILEDVTSCEYLNSIRAICKFLVFLSCTEYKNNTQRDNFDYQQMLELTRGHAMLGCRGLALCGTGCLHTWPQSLDELLARFTDPTRVNTSLLMDDSANRGTYWACLTTTLGGVLHELLHTFGLGHTTNDVMARGFDYLQEYFVSCPDRNRTSPKTAESCNCSNGARHINALTSKALSYKPKQKLPLRVPYAVTDGNFATLSRVSALLLAHNKWFLNLNFPVDVITHQIKDNLIVIKSNQPLAVIRIQDPSGMLVHYEDFTTASRNCTLQYSFTDTVSSTGNSCLVLDTRGNELKILFENVL